MSGASGPAPTTVPKTVPKTINVHATAIAVAGIGILLRGPSRSGKSALALSTLRRADLLGLPAALVADDQVFLQAADGHVEALAPPAIRGLIEVSGVGILAEPSLGRVRLKLVVDLAEPDVIERLPEEATAVIAGVTLQRITLPVRQAAYGADILHTLVLRGGDTDINQI